MNFMFFTISSDLSYNNFQRFNIIWSFPLTRVTSVDVLYVPLQRFVVILYNKIRYTEIY